MGLVAGDGRGMLVAPRIGLWRPHPNTSTGVAQIIDTDHPMKIDGLEYGGGAF